MATLSATTKDRPAYLMNSNPPLRNPSRAEMNAVFQMCRQNRWNSVLNCIRSNHLIPMMSMIMDNHISTTILHQAITSKGDIKARARVIREILDISPKAATIKNGYGSLPLHVIAQRNTKLDAPSKELLINELVNAYKGALVEQGGVGRRTPLHIIFTDYISPRLTEMMIANGKKACFMKDKKGFLPAHVACSRHCSPEKLQMLLDVNPAALRAPTNSGDTLLSLAMSTATRSHPNYALIDDLKRRLEEPEETLRHTVGHPPEGPFTSLPNRGARLVPVATDSPNSRSSEASDNSSSTGNRHLTPTSTPRQATSHYPLRKRKVTVDDEDDYDDEMDPAKLLLHFSRHKDKKSKKVQESRLEDEEEHCQIKWIARV